MTNKYDEIINLPHHISKKHPPLGRDSYAAQFSPFAALTGYDDVVSEAARVTEEKTELDEDAKLRISNRLSFILDHIDKDPGVTITHFLPDARKSGGKYVKSVGKIKKYDGYEKIIYMESGTKIKLENVFDINSELLTKYFSFGTL